MRARMLPVAVALTLLLVAVPVVAFGDPTGPRVPGPRHSTSTNWGGYAALTSLTAPRTGSVTFVTGNWVVSPVNATAANAWSASWVGIDGYASGTVEQIGTEADWIDGRAVYSAWWEMYPKKSIPIKTMKINPGDLMSASVAYSKSGFTLTLYDTTSGQRFTTTQKSGSARLSSAEWILEPPYSGGVLPLANVGLVPFSVSQATIGGHTGPIDDARWVNDPITIVSKAGNTVAVPSALTDSAGSSAFTMRWMSSN